MTARKTIMNALLDLLAPIGGSFPTRGRRLRDPEHAADIIMPALFLIKPSENYQGSTNLPPIRTMEVLAIIYTDIGDDQNAVPADVLDDLLDGIDAALVPPPGDGDGRQTLGGLVFNVQIDGEIDLAPGDQQGKGTAVIPIKIMLP